MTFNNRLRLSTSNIPESVAVFQKDSTIRRQPLEWANGGDRTETTVLALGICLRTSASISVDAERSECLTTATGLPASCATRTWRLWWSWEIQPGRPDVSG